MIIMNIWNATLKPLELVQNFRFQKVKILLAL